MEYKIKNIKGKTLISYKETLVLNDIQRDIIIGTLLGDASMGLRNGKPLYSIKFEQSLNNEIYINHIYGIFEKFVGMVPSKRNIADDIYLIWFRTYRHSSFKFYFDIFYPSHNNYVKVVPKIIKRLLTPRAIAYWYMDDGSLHKNNAYLLNTQSFELSDQKLILKAFLKFNIKANVHKYGDKYRIYILAESKDDFRNLIEPYVIECFYYKL